jgi:hypothetical protein
MTGITCGAGMLIIPEHNEFNPGFNHDFVDHYGISIQSEDVLHEAHVIDEM